MIDFFTFCSILDVKLAQNSRGMRLETTPMSHNQHVSHVCHHHIDHFLPPSQSHPRWDWDGSYSRLFRVICCADFCTPPSIPHWLTTSLEANETFFAQIGVGWCLIRRIWVADRISGSHLYINRSEALLLTVAATRWLGPPQLPPHLQNSCLTIHR